MGGGNSGGDGLFLDTPSVVELTPETFEAAKKSGEVWLIDWYSPVCSHCINFAPTWKRVAERLAGSALHVGAVNCAAQRDLCRDNDIDRYPSLKALHVPDDGGALDKTKMTVISNGGSKYEDLLAWVDKRFPGVGGGGGGDAAAAPVGKAGGAAAVARANAEVPADQAAAAAAAAAKQLEEQQQQQKGLPSATCGERLTDAASSLHYALLNHVTGTNGLMEKDRIDALLQVLGVVSRGLPGLANQASVALLAKELREGEALRTGAAWEARVAEWRVGVLNPDMGWPAAAHETGRDLHSTVNYSSGLWSLFHVLTLSPARGAARAQETQAAIRTFVDRFFGCAPCRAHFLGAVDACDAGACAVSAGPRPLALWLWRMHNAVNVRVAQRRGAPESELNQHVWPQADRCPLCWEGVTDYGQPKWNEDAVLLHLQSTYWCREWGVGASGYTGLAALAAAAHGAAAQPGAWAAAAVLACLCWCLIARHGRGQRRRRRLRVGHRPETEDAARPEAANRPRRPSLEVAAKQLLGGFKKDSLV